MNRYQMTGIIYMHIGMNGWVKRYTDMRISTQNIAWGSQCQLNTCLSFSYISVMSIRWAYYGRQMKQQNSWSVHMTSIGKENRSNQSLSYKEQPKGGGGRRKKRGPGGGWSEGSRKDWAELYGCIKNRSATMTDVAVTHGMCVWERES